MARAFRKLGEVAKSTVYETNADAYPVGYYQFTLQIGDGFVAAGEV
jgi:hypothetical protein